MALAEKAKAAPKTAARRSKESAAQSAKAQLRDAAERGQYQDDYGGDRTTDTVLDSAQRATRGGVHLVQNRIKNKKERPSQNESDALFQNPEPAEPPQQPNIRTKDRSVPSQSGNVENASYRPAIKTKERYIQSQPSDSDLVPEHDPTAHATEQGRTLATKRAENKKQRSHIPDTQRASAPSDISQASQNPEVSYKKKSSVLPEQPDRTSLRSFKLEGQGRGRFPNRTFKETSKIRDKANSPGQIKQKFIPIKSADARSVRSIGRPVSRTVPKGTAQMPRQMVRASGQRMQTIRTAVRKTSTGIKNAAKASAKAVKAAAKSTKALISAIAAGGGVVIAIILVVIMLGSVITMIGGDNSTSVSPVSAEVEAYEPTIRLYATQYGIVEYVELIKAVMMQESGGRGLDPMQAAEGGYNTRYPHEPNGITDPDYSIQCGVQELRDALNRAGVESPLDMEHIKLALQSYNFGPGYCTWAVSNYGGYSLTNAAEFSDMKAAELGWSRYGDKEYVAHVLRYYAFGRLPTGTGDGAIVAVALTQEGNGGETYWRWYGFNERVAWCACFASWCADQAGLIDAGLIPRFSLCSDGVDWFAARGRFVDASYVPATGDLIFFDWGHDGSIDHVGIVESVSGGTVYTIEGNSGDKVKKQSYTIGSSSIYGYGIVN